MSVADTAARPSGRDDSFALQTAKMKAYHYDLDLRPFYDKTDNLYLQLYLVNNDIWLQI